MPRTARPSTDRILGAAEKVFARQGYGETSLRQLMAAARVSTTAFYARFDSKEAVLVALVERVIIDIQRQAVRAFAAVKSPEQGVETGVDVLLGAIADHRRVLGLALGEAGSSAPLRATMSRSYNALVMLMTAQLGAGRESLAWAFVGAVHLQVLRWAVFEEIDHEQLGAALRDVGRALVPAITRGRAS
ncbi:MAG TPA: helix-turn-helix domain-containing protein [Kofleriaceae bacterium]|nr:helix-turn-helix domain-containing protein [Kofleriaceae bacterium]